MAASLSRSSDDRPALFVATPHSSPPLFPMLSRADSWLDGSLLFDPYSSIKTPIALGPVLLDEVTFSQLQDAIIAGNVDGAKQALSSISAQLSGPPPLPPHALGSSALGRARSTSSSSSSSGSCGLLAAVVNRRDVAGRTLLMLASALCTAPSGIVTSLIAHASAGGKPAGAAGAMTATPSSAAEGGQAGIGGTPSHVSSSSPHPHEAEDVVCQLLTLLLDAGADVGARDGEGYTPLHYAAGACGPAAAAAASAEAAQISHMVQGGGGGTDHVPAQQQQQQQPQEETVAATSVNSSSPSSQAREPGARRVALLADRGADVHVRATSSGETPLHRAARSGCVGALSELLKRGSRPRGRSRACLTAWDVAGRPSPASPAHPSARDAVLRVLASADPSLRVAVLSHSDCLAHVTKAGHQEAPERLTAIMRRVRDGRRFGGHEIALLEGDEDVPFVSDDALRRAHSDEYVRLVRALAAHVTQAAQARARARAAQPAPADRRASRASVPASAELGSANDSDSDGGEDHTAASAEAAANAAVNSVASAALPPLGYLLDDSEETLAVPFTPMVQRGMLNMLKLQALQAVNSSRHAHLHGGGRLGLSLGPGPAGKRRIKDGRHSDTSFSPGSLPAALRAAGAVCAAIDGVASGRSRHALCLVRPPGHHSGVNGLITDIPSSASCGFCVFNNVAVGAMHALAAHPRAIRRVAILDFDNHHGNGTEEIVRRWAEAHRDDEPSGPNAGQSLFFFSTHMYDVERRSHAVAAAAAAATAAADEEAAAAASQPKMQTRRRAVKGSDGGENGAGEPGSAEGAATSAGPADGHVSDSGSAKPGGAKKLRFRTSAAAAGSDALSGSPAAPSSGAAGRRASNLKGGRGRKSAGPGGASAGPALEPLTDANSIEVPLNTVFVPQPSDAAGGSGEQRPFRVLKAFVTALGEAHGASGSRGGGAHLANPLGSPGLGNSPLQQGGFTRILRGPKDSAVAAGGHAAAPLVSSPEPATRPSPHSSDASPSHAQPGDAPVSDDSQRAPASATPQPAGKRKRSGSAASSGSSAMGSGEAFKRGRISAPRTRPAQASGSDSSPDHTMQTDDDDDDGEESEADPPHMAAQGARSLDARAEAPPATLLTSAPGQPAPTIVPSVFVPVAAAGGAEEEVYGVDGDDTEVALHVSAGGLSLTPHHRAQSGPPDTLRSPAFRVSHGSAGAAGADAGLRAFALRLARKDSMGGFEVKLPGPAAPGGAEPPQSADASHAPLTARTVPGSADSARSESDAAGAGAYSRSCEIEGRETTGRGFSASESVFLRASPHVRATSANDAQPLAVNTASPAPAGSGTNSASAGCCGDAASSSADKGLEVSMMLAGPGAAGVSSAAGNAFTALPPSLVSLARYSAHEPQTTSSLSAHSGAPAPPTVVTSAPSAAGLPRGPSPAGSAAASSPASDDDEDEDDVIYAFYPGSGKEDALEANVHNAPIMPLWRVRQEHRARQRTAEKATAGRMFLRRAVTQRLVPALRAFGPDLILLSTGFDACAGDVGNTRGDGRGTGGMNLLPEDYAFITAQVLSVARMCCPGRVVSVLEGGYGRWAWERVPAAEAARAGAAAGAPDAPPPPSASSEEEGGSGAIGGAIGTAAKPAAAGDGTVLRPYLDRSNLADCCQAHLRALIDDGVGVGLAAAGGEGE